MLHTPYRRLERPLGKSSHLANRSVYTRPRHDPDTFTSIKPYSCFAPFLLPTRYAAVFLNSAPGGTTPNSANCHRSMNSFRATATMPMRRLRPEVDHRLWNH